MSNEEATELVKIAVLGFRNSCDTLKNGLLEIATSIQEVAKEMHRNNNLLEIDLSLNEDMEDGEDDEF